MPDRVLPAASVNLYDPGAEGWTLQAGFDLYDVPARQFPRRGSVGGLERWGYTPSRRNPTGFPADEEASIEAIPDINVVCPRGRVVYQDTPLAHYSTAGGEWEQFRTLDPPRKQLLVQRKVQADVVWRAESVYFLPANPNLAFTVQRLGAALAQNVATFPAYVEVVIADSWSIRFSDTESAGIWTKISGKWRQVKPLSLSGRERPKPVLFCVRRGAVCISIDGGESWEVIPDTSPITVPAGQLVLEGTGCQVGFGFHQLAFDACSYETYDLPTLEEHLGTPVPDLSQCHRPTGTRIRLVDLPSPPATTRYRIELTPDSEVEPTLGWALYRVPEVYATTLSWPTVLAAPVGGSVDLATLGMVTAIDLSEEEEIEQRRGELTLLWDPEDAWSGVYGWRLVEIALGYYLGPVDGFDLTDRCLMYVIQPEPGASGDWDADVRLELVDLWIRAVLTQVDEGWMPLDGLTPIQARNYVLLKMGINPATRANWLNTGKVLPAGPPDQRRWHPQPGMTAADVFHALDLFEGAESFVSSNGTYTSRVARYTDPGVSFVFDGEGADPTLAIRRIRYRAEHRDTATAVLVTGQDSRGGGFWATAVNYALERNPGQAGFMGFRRWQRYENVPVTSLAEAVVIANQRRALLADVPLVAELAVPGCPDLFRGMVVQAVNVEQAGLTGAEWLRAGGIQHRWRPTKRETETEIRARRVL